MIEQVIAATVVSFVNFGIHAVMTGIIIVSTQRTAIRTDHLHVVARMTALLTLTMAVLTLAHCAEIAVWAAFYEYVGVMRQTGINAFEFAFENFTALGYGNPLPLPDKRLYGPMAALNGLLLIGWSIAIIFEVMRMAEVQIARRDPRLKRQGRN